MDSMAYERDMNALPAPCTSISPFILTFLQNSAERIRYFSLGRFCDIVHKNASDFVNNAKHNRAGEGKCDVDDAAVETLQQRPFGGLAIVNANVVVAT